MKLPEPFGYGVETVGGVKYFNPDRKEDAGGLWRRLYTDEQVAEMLETAERDGITWKELRELAAALREGRDG